MLSRTNELDELPVIYCVTEKPVLLASMSEETNEDRHHVPFSSKANDMYSGTLFPPLHASMTFLYRFTTFFLPSMYILHRSFNPSEHALHRFGLK
jgi:hypothetical protein